VNRIVIEAVPQHAMRHPYDQGRLAPSPGEHAGDWFFDDSGDLVIRVTGDNLDKPEALLVALHELVEAALCRREGVSQEAVDAFDSDFASYEGSMKWAFADEPGDQLEAPYRPQHRRAMLIEHLMAQFMGLSDYGTVA
jgi:hypothetical protein